MPVYAGRRRGTWRVILWIRGQGQWERLFEGSKAEARQYERSKALELCGPSKAASRAIPTWLDWCVRVYEPHAKAHLGHRTWKRARKHALATLCQHLGALRLDAMMGAPIEAYKQARLAAGIKASTLNLELATLGTALRWARDELRIPVGEIKIRKLSVPKKRVSVWTEEEIAKLYSVLRKDSPTLLLPITEFLLNTGCRKEEATAAEWSWVDWRAKMLRIPVTDYWHPKDKEGRDVPLDTLMPMLRALREKNTGRYIFLSMWGTPYAAFPDNPFKDRLKAAGLKGSPHMTRHTYASHFLRAVPDLRLLADVLGHSYTRTTELYAHLLPGHLERARGAVRLLSAEPLVTALAAVPARARSRV